MTAALAAAVAAIYAPAAVNEFVQLDDNLYVFANPHVTRGLSWDGLAWAFTHFHATNWHPLTWLSHMLDCQLFGATVEAAGAHHLVSAGLHAASAILLFLALRRMTGRRGPSALVAALFAVHPLRVESVAWVSERKDVLSGFFFMLTLLAYARYAERPRAAAYVAALAAGLLGLLSKPMLVTLPFVLLLLDFWPLGRWSRDVAPARPGAVDRPTALRTLLLEKVPLFVAAAGVAILTVRAQAGGGAVSTLENIPVPWRFVTAAIAGVTYLGRTVWPSDLAPLYIHPALLLSADIRAFIVPAVAATLFLAAVTAIVVRQARRRPYALTGWLWTLVMLAPVIGLMQVGLQSWADRYAYLPIVGVYLVVAWGVADWIERRPRLRAPVGVVACAALLAYGAAARAQVGLWRDSRTLFEHTLRVTKDNWLIENNLGAVLSAREPGSAEARRHFEEAVRIRPDYADAHSNLAFVLMAQGLEADARRHWEEALRLAPNMWSPHVGLGNLLTRQGRIEEAKAELGKALALNPGNAEVHANLGVVLAGTGAYGEARARFEEAIRLDPSSVLAQHALARLLATAPDPRERDPKRALELARRAAARSEFRRPEVLASLAAAHAAAGEFRQAVAWQERALALSPPQDQAVDRKLLELYRSGKSLTSGADARAAPPSGP